MDEGGEWWQEESKMGEGAKQRLSHLDLPEGKVKLPLQVLQGAGAAGRPGRAEASWLQRLAGQLPAAVISCR